MKIRRGMIMLATCKDPNHTRLKFPSPPYFTVRPMMREPRVITRTFVEGGRVFVEGKGTITGQRKPPVQVARAEADGWGRWSPEYMTLEPSDPRVKELPHER